MSLFPAQAPPAEPQWLTDARRRNAPYAAVADNDFAPAVLDRRALLKAYDEMATRLSQVEAERDELAEKQIALVQELLTEWRDNTTPDPGPDADSERRRLNHRAFFDMKCVHLTGRRLEPGGIYAGIPAKAPDAAPLVAEAAPAASLSKPCTCGFLAQTLGDGCEKCNPECYGPADEDEREIIGTYEVSGLPVYEGDDYVTDAEGCYLTRAEANELKAEHLAAALTTTGEGKRDE